MISNDNALLEQAFEVLNRVYFDGSLPEAVITIQSSPRNYGYITVQKVWADNNDCYHEINISAEHLSRNIENVMSTLMHEMVHLYCIVNNIADTSKNGRYHNKHFKNEAEKRDLKIDYVKYIGYSKTTPTDRFIEVLRENGLCNDINHFRISGNGIFVPPVDGIDGGKTVKVKSSTRKYICENCGISVRATKDVNIICADCMDLMTKVES